MLRGREDGRWRCCKEEAGEDKHIKSMLPSTMGINTLSRTHKRARCSPSLSPSLSLSRDSALFVSAPDEGFQPHQMAGGAMGSERRRGRVLGEEEEEGVFKAKSNE
jgi:hypothetical protein